MKQTKVNAYGRVPLPGGNVAEPSRLGLDHDQRQDAAAAFHEGRAKVAAASSRLPSMDPRQDAAAILNQGRSEVRHPCRRVRARGLRHGPSLGLHLRA